LLALPFVLAAQLVQPVGWGGAVGGCLLLAVTASGSAAAAAALGARGTVLSVALCCLTALVGFVAWDVYPRMMWLQGVSPFVAAARVISSGGSWWAGFLPGVALLALGFAVRGARAAGPDD
jgi:hypothetical protein